MAILELNILLLRNETKQGLVSIPLSIRDGNSEQSSSNGLLKLGFMGSSRFYFWFRFSTLILFILNCFVELLLSKNTFSRMRGDWN